MADPVQETLARIDAAEDEHVEGDVEEPIASPERESKPSANVRRRGKRKGALEQPGADQGPDGQHTEGQRDDEQRGEGQRGEGQRGEGQPNVPTRPPASKSRSAWSAIDLLVALVSLIVLGASIAGFVWLMGG